MLRRGSIRVLLSAVLGAGLGAWAASSLRSAPTCPSATSCCEAPAAAAVQKGAKKPTLQKPSSAPLSDVVDKLPEPSAK